MMWVRDVLDHYGIYYKDEAYELYFLCPFHDDHNLGSASFDEAQGVFYCFACGIGGSLYDFVRRLENVSWEEAYALVDTDFTGKKDYEKVFKLKQTKHLRKWKGENTKEYRKFIEAFTLKVLQGFSEFHVSIEMISKWMGILSYISFKSKGGIPITEKNLLSLYKDFLLDVKQ